jgi:hypothetical protein
MDVQDPRALAAELRIRAIEAEDDQRADLLFLAAEYERMADAPPLSSGGEQVKVRLPR